MEPLKLKKKWNRRFDKKGRLRSQFNANVTFPMSQTNYYFDRKYCYSESSLITSRELASESQLTDQTRFYKDLDSCCGESYSLGSFLFYFLWFKSIYIWRSRDDLFKYFLWFK